MVKKYTDEERIDLLKYFQEQQWQEVNLHREREFKIFTWANGLLIALIGALLITGQNQKIVWSTYGIWGKVIVSIVVVFLVFYSANWQNKERKRSYKNAKVIVHINELLHCYEDGSFDTEGNTPLFPSDWKKWGTHNLGTFRRYFRANQITANFILGILALVMIWLP